MAAFDFPNSPSVNDVYTANGISYKWDGTVWKRVSATGAQGGTGSTGAQGAAGAQGDNAGLDISTGAPSSPDAGDLWFDSDSGVLAAYYNDGNSSQWVEVSTGPIGAQGATGSTGAQGATGSTGAQGAAGSNGGTDIVNDTSPQLGGLLESNGSNIKMADSDIIVIGTGNDLQISHSSNISRLRGATTNDIHIESAANFKVRHQDTDGSNAEDMLICTGDGSVELYHNNSKKFETLSSGAKVTGFLNVTTGIHIPDGGNNDNSISLGSNNDLRIYHNGTASFIRNITGGLNLEDTGGYFRVKSDDIKLESANGQDFLECDVDGAVKLYYDEGLRLATDSGGVTVTGGVDSTTGIFERTNNGTSQIEFSATNETKLKHLSNGQVKFSLVGYNNVFGGAIDAQTTSNYIRILNAANEQAVVCRTNGAVELYYDNSKKLETKNEGVIISNQGNNRVLDVKHTNGTRAYVAFLDQNTTDNATVRVGAVGNDFLAYAGGSERLRIQSDGKMGLGTSSPQRLLHLQSTGDTLARITSADGSAAYLELGDVSDPDGGKIVYDSGSNLTFYSASSERVRIASGGELWVGTTSGVSNSGYGGISLNGGSGSLLSLMSNGTEYLRLFGDSNPAIQFAGVLRLFSGVSGGSAIWGISPNGTTTGANSVTFNLKSTISHTVGVMAVSSSYNTGDLYIRIDNIYNLPGNAWWTFGLWIMSNQTVGTLAGHHSAMVHVAMTGLGSWSSSTFTNIQGSMASSCSVDQHGSNFVEIKLDANDSSRGPVTVLCNGGTFDPPRISFH